MYQISESYLIDGKKLILDSFIECDINNHEEICNVCQGKLVFYPENSIHKMGIPIVKCGWVYTRLNNYKKLFEVCSDDK